ncbi:SET and MYND domain-containing protein 4 [Odontesthes bonariensis]|uniref:protein-lysine N-methyltransferase SMYD4 n=1 Tax=Odontesthes bonariensis TaxID=219752 RepID=UPI003F58E3AF
MDLPCIQWQDHVAQKWAGLDPELKEKFTSMLEIDDVFRCALSLTTQHDLDFVQSVSAGYSVKDTEQAAKCRQMGNSSFKARDYMAATLHYSQGTCFAPQSSEQLSLCFANRSAALYHLQNYQECLDDIDRALKNGYPSHLSHKLQDRRTLCLKHLFVQEKARKDHESPYLKNGEGKGKVRSPSVGALTSGICPQVFVGYSAEKGRHLVATERIAAGDVILIDKPYSCVLIPGMGEVKGNERGEQREVLFGTEHRRCHQCLNETLCPVPCESCSYSRYCSTGCQQEAWEEHHRWECPLGAELMVMGVISQLALRVTLKAGLKNIQMARHEKTTPSSPNSASSDSSLCHSDQANPCSSYHGDSYLSVFHLLHHINFQSIRLRFLCAVTIATLYVKLSKAGPLPVSWNFSKPSSATSQSPDGPVKEGEEAEGSSELWLLGSAALRHMLQLRCNAQAITALQDTGPENSPVQSRQEIRVATAIFPTLSLLNHSCCPNTSLVFSTGTAVDTCGSDEPEEIRESLSEDEHKARGVTMTVRAAKVITPGQEILHCYGPHSSRMKRRERQRLLHEQYYFLCQCEACSLQEEVKEGRGQQPGARGGPHESGFLCFKCKEVLEKSYENKGSGFTCSLPTCGHRMSSAEVSHKLKEVKAALEKAVDLMETEMPGEALQLLKRTESQSGIILAETHPLRGELADATARACASMGDWKNAAFHLERSAVATGFQYGDDSVELGQQLFKLAQLHFNGGARGPALSVIPKVRRLLCLHCGPHCPELQELKAMEECLQGESYWKY